MAIPMQLFVTMGQDEPPLPSPLCLRVARGGFCVHRPDSSACFAHPGIALLLCRDSERVGPVGPAQADPSVEVTRRETAVTAHATREARGRGRFYMSLP